MSRLAVVALASVFAVASAPAASAEPARAARSSKDSKRATSTSKTKSKKKTKKKSKAKSAKRKGKNTKRKSARSRTAHQRKGKAGTRTADTCKPDKRGKRTKPSKRKRGKRDSCDRTTTTGTPLVRVATLQSDGRVRYGPDRMPPGFAWPPTQQMQAASKVCEQSLTELGVAFEPAKPQGMIVDPIVVPTMEFGGIQYTSGRRKPPTLDCQFALALARIGPDLYALGLREVRFGSIYRNTNARSHGQRKDFKSRHALGIAMDIKAFVDDRGRVADVEDRYLVGDPLLHGIEDTVNRDLRFRWVLTPGNDPISHADHFHIEASIDFTAFR